MRPVDQTVFTVPGGNCFSASLASLLEITVEDVPYFMAHEDWAAAVNTWLSPRGLMLVWVPLVIFLDEQEIRLRDEPPPGLHVLSGDLPGGIQHAVVARGRQIVHDPLPGSPGLVARRDAYVIAPLDPVAR